METQLSLGQEVLITIKTIGIDGEGIGFYKRQAVFVDGVIPPEEVVVRIVDLKKGYAVGEALHIKKKAYYRRKPFCRHYGVCGGCQLQHVAYDEQLRLKKELLEQTFRRYIGKDFDIDIEQFEPARFIRHYRYKAQMPVKNIKEGVVTGLYKKDSQTLIPILDCPVHHPKINETNRGVIDILRRHDIRAFDSVRMRGMLRYLVTRVGRSKGEIQVTLVVTIFNKALKKAAQDILALPDVVSVAISKNHDVKNREVFGKTYEVLAGKETIEEHIGDMLFALNPKAFFQLNPHEAERMYAYIQKKLPRVGSMLDLYTGSGAMALYFSRGVEKMHGVDNDEASIKSAMENQRINGVGHVSFSQSKTADYLKSLKPADYDCVIFDPPRKGLDKQTIDQLLNKAPLYLAYVSCNPSTLVKNLQRLRKTHRIVHVKPFDLFPQTSHIETFVLLEKR